MPAKPNTHEIHPQGKFFQPGRNCWQTGHAVKAALLIDCANYYRALYYALCNARHSISILGWDIDSRIELLRGEEARNREFPVRLFNLINRKAKENPDLKIYLDRWNYSIFFLQEREPFSSFKWRFLTPSNVYYCADYKIPFSGCHHQKVVVVDNQIAFCGGMDIALGRWDYREHHIKVKERVDPGGFFNPFKKKAYEPYHDIQLMVSGPVVDILSQLVAERWERATGYKPDPVVLKKHEGESFWPESVKPHFENIEVAVARTVPRTKSAPAIREIRNIYLEEISKAEKSIYIENQYLTSLDIATALNQRLKEIPDLNVLIVSSDHPRGFMEHKAMWSGRVKFCDTAEKNIQPSRFAVTYPVSQEEGGIKTIHIHSKIMIVDDRFFHVGSSNLNNRSMGFDTECDMIIEGKDEGERAMIATLRNNLIREHTGRTEKEIASLLGQPASLDKLLTPLKTSRQHLLRIDNDPYRKISLAEPAVAIGDPGEARILVNIPLMQSLTVALLIGLVILAIWSWRDPLFSEILNQDNIIGWIQNARQSHWSLLWVMAIYILAGAIFFPVTLLNLTTAIVFGPFYGIGMALAGSLASASAAFFAGHFISEKILHPFQIIIEKIRYYAKKGGIMGMTLIRLIPLAPFTLVNLIFGICRVSYTDYIIATVLGLLPGIFAKAMFGGALGHLWEDPEPRVIFYVAGSLLLWVLIIWVSQRIVRRYKLETGL